MVRCPQEIRVETDRARLARWHRSLEWKALIKEHAHAPDAECEHCHGKQGEIRGERKPINLTINHTSRGVYNDFILYTTWNPEYMEICCTTCNWMFEKGMKPCPVCGLHYIKWSESECLTCFYKVHPEIKEAKEKKRLEIKALKKRLHDEEKQRVKDWKKAHPMSAKPYRQSTVVPPQKGSVQPLRF